MASPADRFTRMEKLAIFLIALGQERTREVLKDVDLNTIEHLNAAMRGLGSITAEEKASVMLEFAQFFYGQKDIADLAREPSPPADGSPPVPAAASAPPLPAAPGMARDAPPKSDWVLPDSTEPGATGADETANQDEDERAILNTLEKLRQRLDPGQIDWGRAGYDFGEGFKGPEGPRR